MDKVLCLKRKVKFKNKKRRIKLLSHQENHSMNKVNLNKSQDIKANSNHKNMFLKKVIKSGKQRQNPKRMKTANPIFQAKINLIMKLKSQRLKRLKNKNMHLLKRIKIQRVIHQLS